MPRARRRAPTLPASPSCCWTRTARAGTSSRSAADCWRWGARANSAAPAVSTRCRRPSSPATRRPQTAEETDWPRIAGLYAQLAKLARSPVIELNRAVAVGMAEGPQAALSIVERLADEPALKAYHLLGSVRGDLLQKLGRLRKRAPHSKRRPSWRATGASRNYWRRAAEAAGAAMPPPLASRAIVRPGCCLRPHRPRAASYSRPSANKPPRPGRDTISSQMSVPTRLPVSDTSRDGKDRPAFRRRIASDVDGAALAVLHIGLQPCRFRIGKRAPRGQRRGLFPAACLVMHLIAKCRYRPVAVLAAACGDDDLGAIDRRCELRPARLGRRVTSRISSRWRRTWPRNPRTAGQSGESGRRYPSRDAWCYPIRLSQGSPDSTAGWLKAALR